MPQEVPGTLTPVVQNCLLPKHGWKKFRVVKEWKEPHTAQIHLIFAQDRERLTHPAKDQSSQELDHFLLMQGKLVRNLLPRISITGII